VSAKGAVHYFEKMLNNIGVPIEIEHTEANIPSFMEKWVFYQLTRKEGEITGDVNGDAESVEKEKKVETPVANGTDKKEESEKAEPSKEEKKEDAKKERASPEKKEDKKGAKDLKEKLETSKEKGLTKEKSNLDKKSKKAK